ncbi:hypothetical protein CR513_52229, partial [Mucuna pruriens]
MAYDQANQERKLELQELEELCLKAYENSQIYKKKVKQFHDSRILRKEFRVRQKVLLCNFQLKLIAGKICSRRIVIGSSLSQLQFHVKTESMPTLSQSVKRESQRSRLDQRKLSRPEKIPPG